MLQVIVNERGEESINWNSPLKIDNMIISQYAIIIRLTNVNNLSAVKKYAPQFENHVQQSTPPSHN